LDCTTDSFYLAQGIKGVDKGRVEIRLQTSVCVLSAAMSFKSLALIVALSTASNAALTRRVTCPDGSVTANSACCVLFPIMADLQKNLFDNGDCGEGAHEAMRLTFHDAIGWSNFDATKGNGTDASIIIFEEIENSFIANLGIDTIVQEEKAFMSRHQTISPADFIQFAGAVGLSNCPGAPRLQFLMGRENATFPAKDGTVPNPFDTVDTLLDRFTDAGFGADELVALLSIHTIAAADAVDPTIPGTPFDSTPFVFDTQFFVETQLRGTTFPGKSGIQGTVQSPLKGEMRLQSDHSLARDSRTACLWQANVNNEAHMVSTFQAAMEKLALLGQIPEVMTDCSDVIPIPPPFTGHATLPAGLTHNDIEQACASTPFPTLPTAPGPVTSVAAVPPKS